MLRRSKLEHSQKFVTSAGSPLHPVRHGQVQTDGTIKLITDRLEDTDKIIDSYRQSTDINNILKRIQAGDVSLLNQKKGFFGDFTDFPSNYAEMLQLMHRGEEIFNKLPADVKAKYNNDFNQFFAHFDEAIADLNKKDQKEVIDDVVDAGLQSVVDKEVKE